MTNENKPTSKVIQIQLDTENLTIVALCEDGSIWARDSAKCPELGQAKYPIKWNCILEANTNAK